MQVKAKSNSVITHRLEGRDIIFVVKDAGEVKLEMGNLSTAILERAAIHGMIQRISDAAALGRDTETGASASPRDKLEAMRKLVEYYQSGTEEWKRSGSGEGGGNSITLEAVAQVKGWTYEQAEAEVAKAATKRGIEVKKVLAELRGAKAIREAIEAIRAKRAGPVKADADALLAEMGGEE